MSAPQITNPGASGEWLRTVAEESRSDAMQRRQRFTRMVTYTMAGLTAFTVLGLGCFAWRRHALQADLETPPRAAAAAQPATAAPAAVAAPVATEPEKTTPSAEASAAVAVPAPSAPSVRKPVTKVAAKPSTKKPARSLLPSTRKRSL